MKLRTRIRDTTLNDRAVWQAASLLLAYPDGDRQEQLDTVADLLAHVRGSARPLLDSAHAGLSALDQRRAAEDYVATFDLRRRSTMYLTYWTAGDTRNRGAAMHGFVTAYRGAGVQPPKAESPDHLPVVLEFAARVDPVLGRRLLVEHRVPIDVLRDALVESGSVYGAAVEAVCTTLPRATDQEVQRAQRLAQAGPPAEAVGLQPFTLTVPPRRETGGHGHG
ncbi:nitrate reductase molybdenum cofactor assembly chaperone [[Mycobacterium] wendilense]|uniref:Nitrate reductase molybdenum cofactor assembly chaperone n=1 Tax=[Mycobacterium] wendilense TaxID=3064284 RepID=A0ABN9NZD8_9MYCO|nr:nitrate reductase molybdenum cofactor assembly chaperone [Mycolicibacterium sp. MU0050]CAJ1580614.1 nitrate reductase molybdenum cofactor assembly chaperone [Mycolicibacterium sp. MU0050]